MDPHHNSYTDTPVSFQGPEGFLLAGVLCEPSSSSSSSSSSAAAATQTSSSSSKPTQCAVLCHGFGSHKNGFHFPAIAHHLAQELGLSSLRFDYTGNMDSPGPFRFGGMMKEVEQMAAAKHYLEQQHGKQVVVLIGHSRGAINATLYSGQASIPEPSTQQQQQQACSGHPSTAPDPAFHPVLSESAVDGQFAEPCAETTPATATTTAGATSSSRSRGSSSWSHIIPLVVLVAGRFDLTVNMHQRYGADVVQQLRDSGPWEQRCKRDGDGHQIDWTLSAEDMEERFSLDIAQACAAISSMEPATRPKVLVVHGVDDPICQATDASNLAQHITGSQLLEVPGADHWFKGRQEQLLAAIAEFVERAGREKGLCF